MIFRRKGRREVPGLNTSSTADISFMLLIFFLVTTSMEIDKAMPRKLPPIEDDKREVRDVDNEKVMKVHLTDEAVLMVGDKSLGKFPFDKEGNKQLRRQIKEFVAKVGPTHVVMLETDRNVDYEIYFALQNQIVRSYRELRDASARNRTGHEFAKCSEDMKKQIMEFYPQRIQEIAN